MSAGAGSRLALVDSAKAKRHRRRRRHQRRPGDERFQFANALAAHIRALANRHKRAVRIRDSNRPNEASRSFCSFSELVGLGLERAQVGATSSFDVTASNGALRPADVDVRLTGERAIVLDDKSRALAF